MSKLGRWIRSLGEKLGLTASLPNPLYSYYTVRMYTEEGGEFARWSGIKTLAAAYDIANSELRGGDGMVEIIFGTTILARFGVDQTIDPSELHRLIGGESHGKK